MDPLVPLQFRPTVIIFVGTTGETMQKVNLGKTGKKLKTVYEYFHDLCMNLDKVLFQCVSLIAIDEGSSDAKVLSIGDFSRNITDEQDDFRKLFAAARRDVRGFRHIYDLESAGYSISDTHLQIYIVGQTSSLWVSKVAEWVNIELGEDRPLTFISFALIDFPPYVGDVTSAPPSILTISIDDPQPTREDIPPNWTPPIWTKALLSQDGSIPRVNFCYMYEGLSQRLTFTEEADIRYALAESLFGFVATGITAAPTFREATQLNLMTTDSDSRIGSFGTSLITFPRNAIERYCIDAHSIEFMSNWTDTMRGQNMDEQSLRKVREKASKDALQICDDLSDQEPRPGVDGYLWPNLASLNDNYRVELLKRATENIFRCFSYRAGRPIINRRQEAQAAIALRAWQDVAQAVWAEVGKVIQQRIVRIIDGLWLSNDYGIRLASSYAAELDDKLEQVRDRFTAWRINHRETYETAMHALEERGDGPWVAPARMPNLIGVISGQDAGLAQAVPSAVDIHSDSEKALPSAGPSQKQNEPVVTDNRPQTSTSSVPDSFNTYLQSEQLRPESLLPMREQTVVKNLNSRIDWMRSQVPRVANLVAIGIMVTPPLLFLALTLRPSSLPQPLATLLITIIGTAFVTVSCWGYRRWSQERVRNAEEDLLRAYRLYFTYRCEWWEDQLRVVVLNPLIMKVKRMRGRLENIQRFIDKIAAELQQSLEHIEKELFDGPSGLRDVFVANGELLSKYDYNLADFNQQIRRRRQTIPEEAWHSTVDQINSQMLGFFTREGVSIIDLDEEEFVDRVREFSRMIVAPYLKGNLVDIGEALRAKSDHSKLIWQKALGNSTIFFRSYNTAPEFIYIGRSDEHRAAVPIGALPSNTTIICTAHYEWLLIGRFWTGGARTHWNIDISENLPLAKRLPSTPDW